MDVYSIGGGEIVYEVLKAVALCLNGGSGTLQALFRIGGFCGVFMVYYMILYGNPLEILKRWALPVLMMTNLLFLPTTTVWVKDTITRYHYKIDHVPYGLALFASQLSKFGKAITEIVEQSFSTPDDMKYQRTGMMFGSDILENAKTFRITNRNFKENMRNFVGQCVKYDIMLNQKYSFEDLKNSRDIWNLVTSNPSKNRGIFWIPIDGGRAEYVTCEGAVQKFNQVWAAELDKTFSVLGRKFFTGRFIGSFSGNTPKLEMSPQLENILKNEIKSNLTSVTSYLGDLSDSAEETLKQSLMINAMQDAASENSKSAGNAITYAEVRAIQQQNNTFETLGRVTTKLLPIMKAVIEALAYACFIFIIPFCMVPSGYRFLINWIAVLAWLQAWPPMYAVLNYIMNIAARASTLSEIGTAGGLTIANYAGIADANSEIKLIAGYLSMSIPFICIAIVKGVNNFVHLAGQMTGTSMQAASTSAAEISTGNFSFGNISMRNQSHDNFSQLQRNFSTSLSAGGHLLDTGGTQIRNDARGFSTIQQMVSSGATDFSITQNAAEEFRRGYNESVQKVQGISTKLSSLSSLSDSQTASLAHSLSRMSAQDVSHRWGLDAGMSQQISEDSKVLNQYYDSKNYADQCRAGGNLSIGAGIAKKWLNIGGSANVGIESVNSTNLGSSVQSSSDEGISETKRRFESAVRNIANSDRDDDVTRLARDHTQTMSEMTQLGNEKSYYENTAKNYQEGYNKANSLNLSKRINSTDAAYQVAMENMSQDEAIAIMRSNDLNDVRMKNDWGNRAMEKISPVMAPQMPNVSLPKNWNNSEIGNRLSQEFSMKKQTANDKFSEHENDMTSRKDNLDSQRNTVQDVVKDKVQSSEFIKQKEQIKNKAKPLKENKRMKKGATKAAWDNLKSSLTNKT